MNNSPTGQVNFLRLGATYDQDFAGVTINFGGSASGALAMIKEAVDTAKKAASPILGYVSINWLAGDLVHIESTPQPQDLGHQTEIREALRRLLKELASHLQVAGFKVEINEQ